MRTNFVSKFQVDMTSNNKVIDLEIPIEDNSNFSYTLKRIENNFFNQSINRIYTN